MKSMIILLASVASIGIGATQASAGDAQNLSCITETREDGTTVRDCGTEPIYKQLVKKVAITPDPPIEPGHRGGDGRGGGNGRGGNGGNGGNKGPND